MKLAFLIPARGGSKGVHKKNLRLLYGLTNLLEDTIAAARMSSFEADIYVSSDSDEILACGEKNGACAIKRPDAISNDTASTDEVITHFLQTISETPDVVVLLQCTYPFHTYYSIDTTIKTLLNSESDCAFASINTHEFIWRQDKGIAKGINHDSSKLRSRRQDISYQDFIELGSVYAFYSKSFVTSLSRFCHKPIPASVKDPLHIEIDTISDLELSRRLCLSVKNNIVCKNLNLDESPSCLVFDCDGVLTNNTISMSSNGCESCSFSKDDSMAISWLKIKGIKLLMLTSEKSSYAKNRASKLDVPFISTSQPKEIALCKWLRDNKIPTSQVVYVGNDVNDLGLLSLIPTFIAPSDAPLSIKAQASLVCESSGGAGVLREIAKSIFSSTI